MAELPDFPQQQRTMVLLARRAGLDEESACRTGQTDLETLSAWLEGDERFASDWQRATEADLQMEVVAASVIRNQVKEDPVAAQKWLLEMEAQDKLARARRLTTW